MAAQIKFVQPDIFPQTLSDPITMLLTKIESLESSKRLLFHENSKLSKRLEVLEAILIKNAPEPQ